MSEQELDVRVEELTASGAGGVSVLRVHGPDTVQLLCRWGVRRAAQNGLHFCQLTLDGEVLDEALVCVFSKVEAEVHVHGSPPLVRRLCGGLPGPTGAREAHQSSAGSWHVRAQRALEAAPSELAARVLLDQVEGAWGRECGRLARATEADLALGLGAWIERSMELRRAFSPTRVLIAGPVNAGKSTLFNALFGGERAITSEVAGTTRDLIRERIHLGAWPVELLDGAGQREVVGFAGMAGVEREGQELAHREAARVDWLLWLMPPGESQPFSGRTPARVSELGSCKDLPGGDPRGICALHEPAQAAARVTDLFHHALGLQAFPWEPGQAVAFDGDSLTWLCSLAKMEAARAQELLAGERTEEQESPARH